MSNNKDLRKSLKGPDAFQSSVATGMERAMQYKGLIFTVIGAIVIGTIALAGYEQYQAKQTNARINELGKIEAAYQKETEALNEQRNELREEIGKLTQPTPEGKSPKLSPAQEKRRDELQDKLTAMVPDHSGTLGEYRAFYSEYSEYPEGWMAGTRAAGILVDQKKFAEAKELLAEIIQASDESFFYQVNGRMLYINVLDELNEFDPALAQVDALWSELERMDRMAKAANDARKETKQAETKNPAEDLKPQVLLTKGRLLLRKGDKEAAGKVFDELMKAYEDSAEARQAMSYKALLL